MLDNEKQIKAFKALKEHPVNLPYSYTKSGQIVESGDSGASEWGELIDSDFKYPSSMNKSLESIRKIIDSLNKASSAGASMRNALSDALTPTDFIPLGIGWDVLQKTEEDPVPDYFAINNCIGDKKHVDAVYSGISSFDISQVKTIMLDINQKLKVPPVTESGSAGGAVTTIPNETIEKLNKALEPNLVNAENLDIESKLLISLSNNGQRSKVDAIEAYETAVSVAIISAITSGGGVMNDVMDSVVHESVTEALKG